MERILRRNWFVLTLHQFILHFVITTSLPFFSFTKGSEYILAFLKTILSSKIIIGSLSIFCLLMMQPYILNQKINNFEYFLLILFAVLGLFLLCSSNDFLTAYLAIELQSLCFYVLATFQRNSEFSTEAGLKYFVLGAFSSGL